MDPVRPAEAFRPAVARTDASRRSVRVNVHGSAVEIRCGLPGLRQVIDDLLGSLAVQDFPEGFHPVEGTVEAYDADVVARSMSASAERLVTFGDAAELWRDQERCWLIDDAWGVCEINLLKRTWRSWLIPQADLDPMRAVDQAVLWPMSQILGTRGLTLLPAASIVHRGRGVLLLCPFNLEPELALLTAAGHGLISQRWTALREEDGKPVLLTLPGRVERSPIPQLRSRLKIDPQSLSSSNGPEWVDLAATAPSLCPYAWCDAVMIVEPGRRAAAICKPLTGASSVAAIRRAWPMPELTHGQGHAQLAKRLGQSASVYQVELSRDPRALLRLLEQLPEEVQKRSKLEASTVRHAPTPRVA